MHNQLLNLYYYVCLHLLTILGLPLCPTIFSANRTGDFTNATVTYEQSTPPPVLSTTVTYCPTSSPNCGNMTCTTSPCTISGLNACEDYQLTVVPNNNCGSPTGCTENSVNVTSQGQYSYSMCSDVDNWRVAYSSISIKIIISADCMILLC